jgi:phage terminase large subunit-like protein
VIDSGLGRSLVPDLPLDRAAGDRAVAVFNKLRLADVPGTPTMAEAGGDWFRDIVRALFGSLDPATRARAIRELFLLVPKKNSKTTNGALLMLTALLLNERPNASLIMTAPVQDVAQLAFDAAAGAIELDPVLKKKLHVREHLKTIVHRETKAALEIMSFDPAALTGQKPVAALIDELHVVAKMSKAASAIRQLARRHAAVPGSLHGVHHDAERRGAGGVFRAELMKARAIRDGRQQGAMLPVLYEFPEEMQKQAALWRDPANWSMVTPNAGRSITISRLEEEFATARARARKSSAPGRRSISTWRSASRCTPTAGPGLTSGSSCGAALTFEDLLTRCEVVTVGIDGGGLDDLLGLAVLGRERETGRWLHWASRLGAQVVLERRKEDAPRLLDFVKAGDLTIVDKIGDDTEQVADIVLRVR